MHDDDDAQAHIRRSPGCADDVWARDLIASQIVIAVAEPRLRRACKEQFLKVKMLFFGTRRGFGSLYTLN